MTSTTPTTSTTHNPRRVRRVAGAAAMALATATLTAGITAPTSAAQATSVATPKSTYCTIQHDLRVGPLLAGRTQGNCRQATGQYSPGTGAYPGAWFIGSVAAPDGNTYSAIVQNQWNLPVP
ncbi:hypothetical protein [Corynebacterium sp. AOP12-C2-36]|uniref:hypothetical protein n=1 Tax=Corynebacterium sp. AOP12-C2-36 TaxID=3457723 RepID=UPI00403376B6